MIKLALFVLFSFLSGLSDRIRGGWKGPNEILKGIRKTPRLFEALVFFFMMLAVLPQALWGWGAIAVVLLASLGYQQDNGFRGQFVMGNEGYDENDSHRWYGPVRFGALQGLLVLPLVLWGPAQFGFLIYALILGQLAGCWLANEIFYQHIEEGRIFDIKNAFPGSEFLGPICTCAFWALFIWAGGLYTP